MNRRTIAASIFGAMAAALVGVTVARLLQVAQEILPWWWPWPIIIGGILFIVALLLLVPHSWWEWLGRLLTNTPRDIRTAYWLQSVLRFNQDNIHTAVKSRFSTTPPAWDFGGLVNNPHDPYFEIKLELINTSIFTLSISGIEGEIVIDGSKCLKPPIVKKQTGVEQGDIAYVTITQSVSDPMLKRIQEAARIQEALKFNLTSVFVILETTTKGYDGRKVWIKFEIYDIKPNKVYGVSHDC